MKDPYVLAASCDREVEDIIGRPWLIPIVGLNPGGLTGEVRN